MKSTEIRSQIVTLWFNIFGPNRKPDPYSIEEDVLMITLRYRIAWAFLKLVDGSWRSSRYSRNIFCVI